MININKKIINLEDQLKKVSDRVSVLEKVLKKSPNPEGSINDKERHDYINLIDNHKKAEDLVFITAHKIEFKNGEECFKANDINKEMTEYFRTKAPSNTSREIKNLIIKKYMMAHKKGYRLSQKGINHFTEKFKKNEDK